METRIVSVAVSQHHAERIIKLLSSYGFLLKDAIVIAASNAGACPWTSNAAAKHEYSYRAVLRTLAEAGTCFLGKENEIAVLGANAGELASSAPEAKPPSLREALMQWGMDESQAADYGSYLPGNIVLLLKANATLGVGRIVETLDKMQAQDIVVFTEERVSSGEFPGRQIAS